MQRLPDGKCRGVGAIGAAQHATEALHSYTLPAVSESDKSEAEAKQSESAKQLAAVSTLLLRPSRIVADPTDLITLPAIAVAWWHGRLAIARGSYGRLAVARAAHQRGLPLVAPFADAAMCGAPAERVAELDAATHAWLASGEDEPLVAALAALREAR